VVLVVVSVAVPANSDTSRAARRSKKLPHLLCLGEGLLELGRGLGFEPGLDHVAVRVEKSQ